jgi:hypothetical protein
MTVSRFCFAVAVGSLLSVAAQSAIACSCKGSPQTEGASLELVERSDVVLFGRLEEIHIRVSRPAGEEYRQFFVKFQVVEWLKGVRQQASIEIELTEPLDCARLLWEDTLLIFASIPENGSQPEAHPCNIHLYQSANPTHPSENVAYRSNLEPVLRAIGRSR